MQISIYMPSALVALIDEHAKRHLVSRSHFITRVMWTTLENLARVPAEEAKIMDAIVKRQKR
jgi:metal-responsive CopG/Arc/MetJ family transcriptional regulator